MLGMDMMIKSMLGVEPSEFMAQIEKAKIDGLQIMQTLFNRLEEIQQMQRVLLHNQQDLYLLLRKADLIEAAESLREKTDG